MKIPFKLALLGVVAFLLASVFVRLGFWQLGRLEDRRARNAAWRTALEQPPVVLDAKGWRLVEADPAAFVNRRVRVAGTFDPTGEVVLRGRAHGGRPGVHLVTPLRVDGAAGVVLVNRGWVPSPDGARVDPRPLAEPGPRVVEGVLQQIPVTDDAGAPAPAGEGAQRVLTFRRLDLATLRGRSERPLLPLYVQQLPGADSVRAAPPVRVAVPALGEGNHLSYAVQWFGFAAIAVGGFFVLLFRHNAQNRL